ncbi:hypothetical protein GCM10009624_28120 [Gordonia sinesedis]
MRANTFTVRRRSSTVQANTFTVQRRSSTVQANTFTVQTNTFTVRGAMTSEVIAGRRGRVDRRTMSTRADQAELPDAVPHWLHRVLIADRDGSALYVGCGFFFAPILALVSPWPTVTAIAWAIVSLAGLWLGLLGIAMATGFAIVLRSGQQIPDAYWRRMLEYRTETPRQVA